MYLNLNTAAWRRIAENGALPISLALWGQRHVAARYFSLLQERQESTVGCDAPVRDDPLVILGYWRSGTTLLHEYLTQDSNLRVPTTHACMNPHHFVFTQRQVRSAQIRRPMDSMMVKATSPGEEEFALLGLGASSPYEALLFPERLEQVLKAADPADSSAENRKNWEHIFLRFLRAVHYVEGQYQLVLKSPAHGFRVALLARLFPRSRFVLLVREPMMVFESVVRMWRSLAEYYAFTAIPPDDVLREVVLVDRLRFENKLWLGLCSIAPERYTLIRYEDLVRNPEGTLNELYSALGLAGFARALPAFQNQAAAIASYQPAGILPQTPWRGRVAEVWQPVSVRYGYA